MSGECKPSKMNEEDAFNLDEVDDISAAAKSQLKLIGMRGDARNLLSLFDRKERLSTDEIIVGLYRLYKMEKTRVWVSSTLYNLSTKNLIKKVEGTKGEYRKVNRD